MVRNNFLVPNHFILANYFYLCRILASKGHLLRLHEHQQRFHSRMVGQMETILQNLPIILNGYRQGNPAGFPHEHRRKSKVKLLIPLNGVTPKFAEFLPLSCIHATEHIHSRTCHICPRGTPFEKLILLTYQAFTAVAVIKSFTLVEVQSESRDFLTLPILHGKAYILLSRVFVYHYFLFFCRFSHTFLPFLTSAPSILGCCIFKNYQDILYHFYVN